MDDLQLGLDIAGLVPVIGEFADGANALISLSQGYFATAALSAAAMFPVGGQAATAAKLAKQGYDKASAAKHFVQHNSGKAAREAAGQPSNVKPERHNKQTSRGQKQHYHDKKDRNVHHTFGK